MSEPKLPYLGCLGPLCTQDSMPIQHRIVCRSTTVGPEVVIWDPPVAARRELNTGKTGSGQTPYLWTLLIHFTNGRDPQMGIPAIFLL